jgi:hypothetical protein
LILHSIHLLVFLLHHSLGLLLGHLDLFDFPLEGRLQFSHAPRGLVPQLHLVGNGPPDAGNDLSHLLDLAVSFWPGHEYECGRGTNTATAALLFDCCVCGRGTNMNMTMVASFDCCVCAAVVRM